MTIIGGDCRDILPTFETGSVDLVVTSPPYLAQRRYGDHDGEIGHELTLAGYVLELADVFEQVRRILRPDGWLVLNIGDKANHSGGAGGDWKKQAGNGRRNGRGGSDEGGPGKFRDTTYADQTFLDVPGQVVAELVRRRWRLRLPIVWDKGREAPEALAHVGRPRWSHEMIYLLAPHPRTRPRFFPRYLEETGSVWHFPPGGSGDPHLAPFPDELARRAILPFSLPRDVVLDPFSGSGTTVRVAEQLGRRGIGIELYA